MYSIPIDEWLDKLPVSELERTVEAYVAPMVELLPDRRLGRAVSLAVRGIMGGQTPIITGMAQSVSRLEAETWAAAKCIYRLLHNGRFTHRLLFKGLYHIARCTVQREKPAYVVVAIDPVNLKLPSRSPSPMPGAPGWQRCVWAGS